MVIGVAVELVVIVVEHRHAMHDFRRGVVHPPDRPSRWLLAFGLLGAGLVAIGVAGEFSVHMKAGRVETETRDATEKLVSIAEERAADAIKEAAQLRKDAEDERMARVKIEQSVAWRTFSDEQQTAFASSLKAFAGPTANCGFMGGDMEAFSFSADIAAALRRAKWKVIPPSPQYAHIQNGYYAQCQFADR